MWSSLTCHDEMKCNASHFGSELQKNLKRIYFEKCIIIAVSEPFCSMAIAQYSAAEGIRAVNRKWPLFFAKQSGCKMLHNNI